VSATGVAVSPGLHRFATAGSDGALEVFDLEEEKLVGRLRHRDRVSGFTFGPRSERIAAASHDRKVHIWDLESMTRWRTLEGHLAELTRVRFSPDGRLIASSGRENRTRL